MFCFSMLNMLLAILMRMSVISVGVRGENGVLVVVSNLYRYCLASNAYKSKSNVIPILW